jgi:hypothetical protein
MLRKSAAIGLILLLGACGGTGATTSGSGRATTIRSPSYPASRPGLRSPVRPAPQIQVAPGTEGVIGASADQLVRMFGAPRLDIHEEDARKLQWSGTACILDAYLYPPANGGQQSTTYIDTRRGDGRDVDRAACIAALRKQ